MTFAASIASVSVIYLVVFFVERVPRLRFRPLSFRRAYVGTDLAWYGTAIAMTGLSVFVVRPLLDGLQIAAFGSAYPPPRSRRRWRSPRRTESSTIPTSA